VRAAAVVLRQRGGRAPTALRREKTGGSLLNTAESTNKRMVFMRLSFASCLVFLCRPFVLRRTPAPV
jgi:hypothetical protein